MPSTRLSQRSRTRAGLVRGLFGLLATSGVVAGAVAVAPSVRGSSAASPGGPAGRLVWGSGVPVPTAAVRRADLESRIVAAGRVESSNSTEIRCELERPPSGTQPTILSLVSDGTPVNKGDVLCELDASAYRELVRQQTIRVQEARAGHLQAELSLAVAKLGVESYRLGELTEYDRQFRGQIALTQADLNRQEDRLAWTRRMREKGYASILQVANEEQTLLSSKISLARAELTYKNFQRFTAPKSIRALESQVNSAQANLEFETIRLRREEEKLANYEKQVGRCVVRAPHDGLLIYANEPGRDPEIEQGAPVRQRQRLFTLPDLSKMEVQVMLHETVVSRVRPGMPVRVWIDALPGRTLTGAVSAVAPLPIKDQGNRRSAGSDVTYFVGKVALDEPPPGLRPGMSAGMEIVADRREGALAVPLTAVSAAAPRTGRSVCRVLRPDGQGFDLRAITLGVATHDLHEVVEGLAEGEHVALNSSEVDGDADARPRAWSALRAWWPWD